MEERKMKRSIYCTLSILSAWREGRIKVTEDRDDIEMHKYSVNTLMTIIENNLLEGVHEPTQLIKKEGENGYEIFRTISRV